MFDDEMGPGPIDSFDAYMMGLRPPRCNGCSYARKKWTLGDKFLARTAGGWTSVYELDATPRSGQGSFVEHEARPVRFHASYMSIGHSDECYHWRPSKRDVVERLIVKYQCHIWTDREGNLFPIVTMSDRYIKNVYNFLRVRIETKKVSPMAITACDAVKKEMESRGLDTSRPWQRRLTALFHNKRR